MFKNGDLWGISVTVLNTINLNFAAYLALFFNNCVEFVTFPDLMKYSKIVLIWFSVTRRYNVNNLILIWGRKVTKVK